MVLSSAIPVGMNKKVELLKSLNRKHSDAFCSSDAQLERRLYRSKHKTKIFAFQCSDGREHLALMTQTPLGIIKSFRNIGSKFDLGWPYMDAVFDELTGYAFDNGQLVLVVVTYHYSVSKKSLGCAGHNHNKESAMASAFTLAEQIERVYGNNHRVVCPIVCGVETDKDALILHGDSGKVIDLSEVQEENEVLIVGMLKKLYKKMPLSVLNDFLPLVMGNIRHVKETKEANRPIPEIEHKEWIIAVGRGFDWLYEPNTALIIGPYYPNLKEPIGKAAGVIKGNMEKGRIPADGFIILASATHSSDAGIQINRAREKAVSMSRLVGEAIIELFPEMADVMHVMAVTTNLDTRRFEEIKV